MIKSFYIMALALLVSMSAFAQYSEEERVRRENKGLWGVSVSTGPSSGSGERLFGVPSVMVERTFPLDYSFENLVVFAFGVEGIARSDRDINPDGGLSEAGILKTQLLYQLDEDIRLGVQYEKAVGNFMDRAEAWGAVVQVMPSCDPVDVAKLERVCFFIEGLYGEKDTWGIKVGVNLQPRPWGEE